MSGLRFACAVLALGAAAAGPPASVAPTPSSVAPTGRLQADAEVRLALQAEAEGQVAERLEHLQKALKADPQHPTALGLMGILNDSGRQVRPDDVSRKVKTDAVLAEVLAEYNIRRADAGQTVNEQWDLAVWCERTGLTAEAVAHFTAVTRLSPNHKAAWHRLGYRSHNGRWMTDAEIHADETEVAAQDHANRTWRPRLVSLRKALHESGRSDNAKRELNEIADPRAVSAVWSTLALSAPVDQAWAVRVFGHIDAPEAAHRLATLATDGSSASIRKAAVDRLLHFDPGIFVGLLINRLREPTPIRTLPVEGPDAPGELWVAGPEFNTRWLYVVATQGSTRARSRSDEPRVSLLRTASRPGEMAWANRGENVDASGIQDAVEQAQRRLERDARTFEMANAQVAQTNERTLVALHRVTGTNLGPEREPWTQWWSQQLGYTYESPTPVSVQKPTITHVASTVTARPAPPPMPVITPRVGHHSCFAAGTLVHCKRGTQAIESIKVGDQVLSQDTGTGELSYQPVVAVFHNPPSATVRVGFPDEEVIATGIHRFWKIGQGWTMARDLKSGDAVRALGGVRKVVSVSEDRVRPVFNLEVAANRDYLVGKQGILVHDHSLVRPTFHPFDATRQRGSAIPATTARTPGNLSAGG